MKKSLLLIGVCSLFIGCGPSAEELAARKRDRLDSIAKVKIETAKVLENDTTKKVNEIRTPKHWSSSETKLPSGIVEASDCAGRNSNEPDLKDNYVTIKQSNGISTIVRDIDVDLYLNLMVGDIIE